MATERGSGKTGNKEEVKMSAKEDRLNDALNAVPEGWEEEQVGFPPYWNPVEVGNFVFGIPILKDERDPDFIRYVFQATKVTQCFIGPASEDEENDTRERVTVQPGEWFTMGSYGALPVEDFMGHEVMLIVKEKRKLAPNESSNGAPRKMWVWKVMVSKEVKQLLSKNREEQRNLVLEKRKEFLLKQAEKDAANPLMHEDQRAGL